MELVPKISVTLCTLRDRIFNVEFTEGSSFLTHFWTCMSQTPVICMKQLGVVTGEEHQNDNRHSGNYYRGVTLLAVSLRGD